MPPLHFLDIFLIYLIQYQIKRKLAAIVITQTGKRGIIIFAKFASFILSISQPPQTECPRQDLNLHGLPPEPKSGASAISATGANISYILVLDFTYVKSFFNFLKWITSIVEMKSGMIISIDGKAVKSA